MSGSFGKYRVVARIASGGMADVYRAELPGPAGFVKEVALKVVRGGGPGDSSSVPMFIQEARLASRLGHANVVQVLDFGREGDRWYIAMELVRGHSLRAVAEACRAEGVRFGLARAVEVGVEVARALAYAHRLEEDGRPAGLVHRDVSPQNVLVSFEGEVKLADFGIARALGGLELTAPGTLKGKLAYMAPEQARAEPVDGRADVFALGVVLWELCAGRRLFARDGEAAILAAVTGAEPISPPSAWNELVPPALDAALMRALARDPALRTPTADELERELAEVRHAEGWRPEDLDLRPLMRRLWPEGARGPSLPGAAWDSAESGATRAGAEAAGPERRLTEQPGPALLGSAEPTAIMPRDRNVEPPPAGGGPGGAVRATPPGAPDEAITRTLRRPPSARVRLLPAGAAILAALACGGGWWWARRIHGVAVGAAARPISAASTRPALPAPASTASSAQPAGASVAPPSPIIPVAAPSAAAATRASIPSPPPAAPSRPAILTINAWPWASVRVDGEPAGDTPQELRLPPGRHHVELTHPKLPSLSRDFELAPGARRVWSARLKR
ncbi:MAG TPA: protein kinase [Anaeromyxobacteraceae bacterium]|nr:protein kinase [Anaeromyxobacteraceae bacterium]